MIGVVRVANSQNIPSIGLESCAHVFGECEARTSLDRDVVVVENPAEVVESQMTRQRRRLRSHAFHEAAITANRINFVVEHVEARPVEPAGEPLLSDCHTNACSHTLS